MKPVSLLVFVAAASLAAFGQASIQPQTGQKPPASQPVPRSQPNDDDDAVAPPVGDNESSSRQTRIDISPPRDDAKEHPDSAASDVTEMHAWNPHKAEKDVEVGEFYLKRKNYRAAEDRFREALTYKPGDANATFRLGEALEAQGHTEDARADYETYLKILPEGKYAKDAKKALERLQGKSAQR
jgi:tetratricopeptide (TPR) repeat protein